MNKEESKTMELALEMTGEIGIMKGKLIQLEKENTYLKEMIEKYLKSIDKEKK